MTVTTSWRIEIDEPNVTTFQNISLEVSIVQCHNFFVIIINSKVIIVVIPGLILGGNMNKWRYVIDVHM